MLARRNILLGPSRGHAAPGCRCRRGRGRLGGAGARRNTQYAIRNTSAFTLMELILVMTVLAIAVSITAPALSNFLRGRTLDSEARRLLSLTRHGQSRVVAAGM